MRINKHSRGNFKGFCVRIYKSRKGRCRLASPRSKSAASGRDHRIRDEAGNRVADCISVKTKEQGQRKTGA